MCVARTLDGGEHYLVTNVNFDPETLLFHPNITEVVLAYDSEHSDLYVSSNFGADWESLSGLYSHFHTSVAYFYTL